MAAKRVTRLRIVTALLASLILVSIVPMVISHFALVRINREALATAEKKYLTRSAVTLSQSTRSYLRDAQMQLRRVADGLKLAAEMGPDRQPFIFAGRSGLLGEIMKSEPNFLLLRAVDAGGQAGDVRQVSITQSPEAELSRVLAPALRGEAVVGDVIRGDGYPDGAVVMSVPVTGATGLLGAVEGLVSLSPVREWLEDEKKRDVVAYLVDRRGNLVLASDPAAVGDKDAVQRVELVEEFVAHRVRLTRSYVRRDRRVLGTVAPVDFPDWGVIVEKDEASAFASVSQMTDASSVAALVALGFAVLVALFAARLLSRPVIDLVAKVKLIGQGNFSQRVEVRGMRELAELAETFNSMSDSLEKSIEKLKQAAKENQELFINSIRTLAAAIDAKDPYTRGHSERVARYAVVIARHLDLTPEEIRKVRISAMLHDVGKIGIDDRILRKPTALTDEEFEVMKTHPVKGALIMGQIPELRDVIPGIKHHHEKWDGGGYPDGLKGVGIPQLARIVAVADTFDAMTTTRPYQRAMQTSYVVSRIKSFSGTRFDPAVVDALTAAYDARAIEVVSDAGTAPRLAAVPA